MLVKWDPLKEIEQTLAWWGTQPFRRPLWDDRNEQTVNWAPAVNVYEDKESLYVETQLPGIDMKEVNISVADRTLSIHGERKVEHEDNKDGYHFREAQYGTFARSFHLPKYVNSNEAKATYDNGVLVVKLPIQEEAKPKVIPIELK
jgi:HSP20 family protein